MRAVRLHGRRVTNLVAVGAGVAAFALLALTAIAPPPATGGDSAGGYASGYASGSGSGYGYAQASRDGTLEIVSAQDISALNIPAQDIAALNIPAQNISVPGDATRVTITRDDYSSAPGVQTFAAGRTNRDWASLVLFLAGFPTTDTNITVMLRWMRQENGVDDWWNRNNPLNNGWGSGGGSGFGSYDTLETAAANAAEALHSVGGYSAIVAGFAASAPTAEIESAIWASPWASSHYANGAHWSYAPVPSITSPSGTW